MHKSALTNLIIANLIWAAAISVIKVTLQNAPPFGFLFTRLLIVCILILPHTLYLLKKENVAKRDYFNIILLGIFSQGSLVFIFEGLKYTSVVDTVFISILTSVLTIYLGHYLYNEKFNANIKFGLILSIVGTLIILLSPAIDAKNTDTKLIGNLLVLIYTLMGLMHIVWSKSINNHESFIVKHRLKRLGIKPMSKEYSPELLTSVSFYIGLAIVIPLAITEPTRIVYTSLSLKAWLGILYMALVSSLFAYYAFQKALKTATLADTALIGYLQPIMAIPVAFLLLGETPGLVDMIAAGFIVTGVWIAEKNKNW